MLDNLFTQSPIHGSAAPNGKGNIFGSVDDFIRESAVGTKNNSSKKKLYNQVVNDDDYQTNDPAITDFLVDDRLPSARSTNTKTNLNLNLNTDENLATYESTSYSN